MCGAVIHDEAKAIRISLRTHDQAIKQRFEPAIGVVPVQRARSAPLHVEPHLIEGLWRNGLPRVLQGRKDLGTKVHAQFPINLKVHAPNLVDRRGLYFKSEFETR